MSRTYKIYELGVSIVGIAPPVWRALHVDADITLRQLHHMLQAAFGWESSHPHEFAIGPSLYRDLKRHPKPLAEGSAAPFSDTRTTLSAIADTGSVFEYRYGASAGWKHRIEVISVFDNDFKLNRAHLIHGERGGVVEECADPSTLLKLISVLKRADGSPEFHAAVEIVKQNGPVNPEYCDGRAINGALNRLAENGGGRK